MDKLPKDNVDCLQEEDEVGEGIMMEEEEEQLIDDKYADLLPGGLKNPDYTRNILMEGLSNEVIIGAIRAAQKDSARNQKNLSKPSFVDFLTSENKGAVSCPPLPKESELFTHTPSLMSKDPEYVMAANGCPTTYFKIKNKNGNNGGELDEDLRRKVESLQIGVGKDAEGGADGKSYEDWKDELPIHIKSLKFMIDVLNDRHKNPGESPSATLSVTHPPIFGDRFKGLNVEFLNDTWSDPALPQVGDRIYPPPGKGEVVVAKRPLISFPSFGGIGRKPRVKEERNVPRRRTKSAEPDLSSYRNETLYGLRGFKHRNSDGGTLSSWCRKRRSVDLNGVYVVEEISEEEEEDIEVEQLNMKRISSVDGSPDSLSIDLDLNLNLNPTESNFSHLKAVHRLRRDLWNISPISEDCSESDKDAERGVVSIDGGICSGEDVNTENSSISSTNATYGDGDCTTASMSLSSRLNCSSPILSFSPSLMHTPTYGSSGTPPIVSSSGSKKVRDIARALDDISDREESLESSRDTEDEEPDQNGIGDDDDDDETEEEKTESFEIDISSKCSALGIPTALNTLIGRASSPSIKSMDCSRSNGSNANATVTPQSKATNVQEEDEDQSTTVWQTLSANIQQHMDVGNQAGFIEGPIDHPIQILPNTKPTTETETPSYLKYDRPLAPIPKYPD